MLIKDFCKAVLPSPFNKKLNENQVMTVYFFNGMFVQIMKYAK